MLACRSAAHTLKLVFFKIVPAARVPVLMMYLQIMSCRHEQGDMSSRWLFLSEQPVQFPGRVVRFFRGGLTLFLLGGAEAAGLCVPLPPRDRSIQWPLPSGRVVGCLRSVVCALPAHTIYTKLQLTYGYFTYHYR